MRWCSIVGLLSALVVLLTVGCGRKDAVVPAPQPLASVNGVAITEEDFAAEIQRRRESGRPIGDAKEVLDNLIQREAMLQAAEASGVLQEPEVERELENKQLRQWLDRSLNVERDRVTVSDDELKQQYEANLDTYTKPARVRLAILYRKLDTTHADGSAEALKTWLEQGRDVYMADPAGVTGQGRIPGFGSVAAEYSEDTISRYRGGDLGWINPEAPDVRYPAEVMEAGIALQSGEISEVIAAGNGLYLVMQSDQRPSQVTPFEEVVPTLRRQLIRLKQDAVEQSFMSNLISETSIEINEAKAGQLTVPDLTTRASESGGLARERSLLPGVNE